MTYDQFKARRIHAHMTQKQAAEALGVCVHTVKNWENRRRKISPAMEILIRIVIR